MNIFFLLIFLPFLIESCLFATWSDFVHLVCSRHRFVVYFFINIVFILRKEIKKNIWIFAGIFMCWRLVIPFLIISYFELYFVLHIIPMWTCINLIVSVERKRKIWTFLFFTYLSISTLKCFAAFLYFNRSSQFKIVISICASSEANTLSRENTHSNFNQVSILFCFFSLLSFYSQPISKYNFLFCLLIFSKVLETTKKKKIKQNDQTKFTRN